MKKRLSIIISIIVILGIIIGVTLALIRKNIFNQNVGFNISGLDAYIIYSKGTDVLTGTLDPVASYSNTAMSTEITLYKSSSAASRTIYGHIYLDLTTISSTLAAEPALKWAITSNNTLLNQGNFTSYSQGDSIPLKLNIPLTTTLQKFQIYVWLDESVDIEEDIEGEMLSTIVRAEATENKYPEPLDDSGANRPDLVQGLIPVMYDTTNSTWVKADTEDKNGTYKWYDYDNKQWANAVLVSSTNRSTYMNASAGTAIPESEVLAYYVWIPRYKYKVFNITKTIGTDSYSAQTTGIDIVFENGIQSSGTVSCNYNFAITDGSLSEICTGNNGDYYTHPAFTFGDKQVRGIWVGKFEISSETPDVLTSGNYYGGGNVTNLTVRSKPNVKSWRYNTVTNFYKVIYDMQIENNIYGLNTSRTNTDSHMLKNMEWGAVAYFTNSKYGRCTNNTCTEVTINNSSDYITGNAGSSVSASSATGTTNAYDTAAGQLASTTGNIYGVYDTSGGSWEYVMGNMSSAAGSYTYYASSGGTNYTYTGNEKYIDTYANGSTYNNQTAYNRSRLGDATGETKSWYSDYANFVHSTNPWFYRGGGYINTTGAGPFFFSLSNIGGGSNNDHSARLALLSTSN